MKVKDKKTKPDVKDKLMQATSTSICNRAIHTLGTRGFFSRTAIECSRDVSGSVRKNVMSMRELFLPRSPGSPGLV